MPLAAPPPDAKFGPPPSDIAIVQAENRRTRFAAPAAPPPSIDVATLGPEAAAGMPQHGQKLATITFNRGTALDNERLDILRQVADMARARGASLLVIGHASGAGPANDPVRRRIANFSISQDRANAVASALMKFGLPAETIEISAVGDAEPLERGAGASNQRAEIFLAN